MEATIAAEIRLETLSFQTNPAVNHPTLARTRSEACLKVDNIMGTLMPTMEEGSTQGRPSHAGVTTAAAGVASNKAAKAMHAHGAGMSP